MGLFWALCKWCELPRFLLLYGVVNLLLHSFPPLWLLISLLKGQGMKTCKETKMVDLLLVLPINCINWLSRVMDLLDIPCLAYWTVKLIMVSVIIKSSVRWYSLLLLTIKRNRYPSSSPSRGIVIPSSVFFHQLLFAWNLPRHHEFLSDRIIQLVYPLQFSP